MPLARHRRLTGRARTAVLADGWYSWLGESDAVHDWTALSTVLGRLPGPLARGILGSGFLRGMAMALLSSRYGAVAVIRYDPGWRTLLLARALCGRRRKLVVFQFFDHAAAGRRARLWRVVDRWALGRGLALAQVLTQAELDAYPRSFGIPARRFRLIRFPSRSIRRGDSPPAPRRNGPVLAAGRAHCDWRTLFAAAGSRGWDLQVVCSGADRALVEHLNAVTRAGAQISVDLPSNAAHALLARAAISVICVEEGLVGRGHIRLLEATDTATAVVASDVLGLVGYAEDGVTALLVAPGDVTALRAAVERLLGDPELRSDLARRAFAAGSGWTGPDYVAALQALAAEAATVSRRPERRRLRPGRDDAVAS